MRALFVNHTAEVSGAERSLLELLAALPASVQPLLAVPRGRLSTAAGSLGLQTTPIIGTEGSLRLHPVHTTVAVGQLGLAGVQIGRAARRHRAEIVHANSIRAGLALALAHTPRAAKLVHVRDCLPPGPLTSAVMRLIAASATTIVANSAYTARSVTAAAPGAAVAVVHNSVDLVRFDPARLDRAGARARLQDVSPGSVLLGVLAQLSPWKGQDTAIETLRLLREQGVDAHLLLIGSAKFVAAATRFDNGAFVADLRARVARYGLESNVSWLGEREDVPELVRALDILMLPSSEEPFGRALIEAMALEVPVLATSVGGPPEIVRDGLEGYLLPPGEPAAWAQGVRRILERPDRGLEMGRAGRRRVQADFTPERHASAMLELYERVLGGAEA